MHMNFMRAARRRVPRRISAGLGAVFLVFTVFAACPATAVAQQTGAGAGASAPTLKAEVTTAASDQDSSSAPCEIGPDTSSCTSSDPTLSADWTNFGDTTGCLFSYTINWGDGSAPESGQEEGGAAGSYVFATHTYKSPGTYTYSVTGSVVSGNCYFEPGSAQFTYAPSFTVTGSLAVLPSESQDTHANTPHAVCNLAKFAKDEAEGNIVASGFSLIGAPDAATLLRNFLAGTGTPINFPSGSDISEDLLSNPQFKSLNNDVQAAIQHQLAKGDLNITLHQPTLRRIGLYTPADLEWSFGGTQGLEVTGSGNYADGSYVGSLTFTIEDSYGFTTLDTFHGVGTDMRYLQTDCGNPPHAGGAHWFPDSVTLTVAFNLPATG
jgi:hypothetical protein